MLNISFSLDNLIILFYLVISLAVGLYFGRGNKSIRDYAIGERNFSDMTLISTIIATAISGSSVIFISSEIYKHGVAAMILFSGLFFATYLRATLMAPRFQKYHRKNLISAGEIMFAEYGKIGQFLTGIGSFLVCSGFIAMQLRVVGEVFSYCLNIDANLAIFTSSIIVIIYASFGGIKSVAFTDVLQLKILVTSLLVIAYICFKHFNSYSEFLYNIPNTKLNINNISQEVKNYYISLFLFFTLPIFTTSDDYQRMLMAKDTLQAENAYSYSALVMFGYVVVISFISFSILIMEPKIEPNQAFINIIDHHIPSGLRAIALIGVYAMVMSTTDSYINCSGVALINDVLKPLGILRPSKDELLYARIIIFIVNIILITVIALFSAVSKDGVVSILLKMSIFWSPMVAPALFLCLFEFTTTVKNLILAAIIGIITVLSWDYYNLKEIFIINNLIAGAFANFISLIFFDKISKFFYHLKSKKLP